MAANSSRNPFLYTLVKVFSLLAITITLYSCDGEGDGPDRQKTTYFKYEIDQSITPESDALVDEQGNPIPLGAVVDDQGVKSEFVLNELVITPETEEELIEFVERVHGKIVETNAVPKPPAELKIAYDPNSDEFKATSYVVQYNPEEFIAKLNDNKAKLDGLASNFGLEGDFKVSSEKAVVTLAMAIAEISLGGKVSPNYFMRGSKFMLHDPKEGQDNSGNIFHPFDFSAYAKGGPGGNVVGAWQLMAAGPQLEFDKRVRLAIIDGGFWVDDSGNAATLSMGDNVADFPGYIPQYDFVNDDYNAGGPNPNHCTGGHECPWHGNTTASASTAKMNNNFGAVGSGAMVAEPMFFKVKLTSSQVAKAVRTATKWHARVISMSFGGECDQSCQIIREMNSLYLSSFAMANKAGVILVASAGNDGHNSTDKNVVPCVLDNVICVGATENNSPTPKSYSNYGPHVDIWAPTDLPVAPNPDTWPDYTWGTGTSTSCPFVAGVIAMIKYYKPDLNTNQIQKILQDTAGITLDPKIGSKLIRSADAVASAMDNKIPKDSYEDNNDLNHATGLALNGTYGFMSFDTASDVDYYRFTINEFSSISIDLEYMTGLGDIFISLEHLGDGLPPSDIIEQQLGTGRSYYAQYLAPGDYILKVNKILLPSIYHIKINRNSATLNPDQFETNDSSYFPTKNKYGMFELNFNNNIDVDYFKYDITTVMAGIKNYEFSIYGSDNPINVTVRDSSNNILSSGPSLHQTISEPTSILIKVENPSGNIGRYIFKAKSYMDPALMPQFYLPADKFWWLDILGQVDFWLEGFEEFYVFEYNEATNEAELNARGTHINLLDEKANILAEGTEVLTYLDNGTSVQTGEKISLNGLEYGKKYVLHLFRDSFAEEGKTNGAIKGTIGVNIGY